MIVRYTRRAQGDLAKILNYLDERSPRGALSVRLAIKRTIDAISHNPSIGHPTAIRASAVHRSGDILISFSGRLKRTKSGCCTFAMARGESGAVETFVTETTHMPGP
jgi:plasmid stabilization system protein ParE